MSRPHRAFHNLCAAIRRRKRRLLRSMSHVRQPRAADLERWRAWEAEIEELEAARRAARPDLWGENDAER